MLIELKWMLLDKIKPIKYNKHNIIIDEIKEIMWWEEFWTTMEYIYLDKTPAIPPATMGLTIQFEISNTMQDICNNLSKYKIVLRIVVTNSANKYALNPYTGTKKYIMEIFNTDSIILTTKELTCWPRALSMDDITMFKYIKGQT